MAIPKLKKQDVIDALKFIDENGVPEHNTSVKNASKPRSRICNSKSMNMNNRQRI